MICSLPDVGELDYMLSLWDELGKYRGTGFGIEPIPWSEIKAFAESNRVGNWEIELLHKMSKTFVESRSTFEDLRCEPPYMPEGWSFAQLSAQAADAKLLAKK